MLKWSLKGAGWRPWLGWGLIQQPQAQLQAPPRRRGSSCCSASGGSSRCSAGAGSAAGPGIERSEPTPLSLSGLIPTRKLPSLCQSRWPRPSWPRRSRWSLSDSDPWWPSELRPSLTRTTQAMADRLGVSLSSGILTTWYKHVQTCLNHVYDEYVLCYSTYTSCTWLRHVHTFMEMHRHVYTFL